MKLTIYLDQIETVDRLSGIVDAAKAYIRNRQSNRSAITASAVKAKIKELEQRPTLDNVGLVDVLKAQLPEIEQAERKTFTPERYRQELSSRWPVQYQYLERDSIDPADPNVVEKLKVLDIIESEGNQCNQRPDMYSFDSPNMARRNPDEILWQNAMANRKVVSNAKNLE
jgi:hypothetical protein